MKHIVSWLLAFVCALGLLVCDLPYGSGNLTCGFGDITCTFANLSCGSGNLSCGSGNLAGSADSGNGIWNAGAEVQAAEALVDSGLDYTETVETINNPGMGYTSTLWYVCKPGDTPTYNPKGNLVLMFIDIGAFSSGVNGTTDADGNYTEGTDYDLDEAFFTGLRGTFENCRQNGSTIAVRFRYDANGKSNPEPETFDQVLYHISQIKENGILSDYQDILMFVESGFVGSWGEQHGGKYTTTAYKAQLLDAVLDMVPSPIPVTVRTWDTYVAWAGLSSREDLAGYTPAAGSDAARVGMFNDGYMGSDSDLGTYTNREVETDWMSRQMLTAYFGGEFSGNLEWAQKFDNYLPQNALPEMYKTHLSYINGNIFQLYKNYTFSAEYDVTSDTTDHSAYYGQTVYQFIRDHIGYRFVLRDSDLSASVEAGGLLSLDFDVENTGFANPIHKQVAQVILEKDGTYVTTTVDLDDTKWYSCQITSSALNLKLPGYLEEGTWNVYLRLSVGTNSWEDCNARTVKFANNGTWDAYLGANKLGSFTVTASDAGGTAAGQDSADNRFYQCDSNGQPINESNISDGELFWHETGSVVLDGVFSEGEWTDAELLGTADNGAGVYVKNDSDYVYLLADIPADAEGPVYNLQYYLGTRADNDWYWYYLASQSGFIYTNKGGLSDVEIAYQGNVYEMRLPLNTSLGLAPGKTMTGIYMFIQDQPNNWAATTITAGDYTIKDSISFYTGSRDLTLKEGNDLSLTVRTSDSDALIQWYHNGTAIEGAVGTAFTHSQVTADDAGEYSVTVTNANGYSASKIIANVTVLSQEQPVLTGASLSVTAEKSTTSSKKIKATGAIVPFAELTEAQKSKVTEHGIIYIASSRLGSKALTIDTRGRTRVSFSAYREDGSFSYTFRPASAATEYTMVTYILYDGTYYYSDSLTVSLNTIQ